MPDNVVNVNKAIEQLNIQVDPPKNFDVSGADTGTRWMDWKLEFEVYADIIQLDKHPKTVQKGVLLRAIGITGHKTYKTLKFSQNEHSDDLSTILRKFDERFQTERNEAYETYIFRMRAQKENEQFDDWLNDLRLKAATCNF